MALSANADYTIQDVDGSGTVPMVLLNAAVVYYGSLCSSNTTEGEVKPFDGTQADNLVGWHFGDAATGNSTGARVEAVIKMGGFVIRDLTVAGVLGTAADYNAPVYATDDGTYTVTDPGSGSVVGRIIPEDGNRASGTAHVYMVNVFGT